MRTCSICHRDFEKGERLIANSMETFIFKPAHVQDTINPAKVSPSELAQSRQDYKKTEMATVFLDFDGNENRPDLFNVRHAACVVIRTGSMTNGTHPFMKHAVRFQRSNGRQR